jgi:uncharacterized protein YcfL
MKRLTIFLAVILLLLQGCNSKKELSREEALQQI